MDSPDRGTWSSENGLHKFGSQHEAFGWGVGYMNQFNSWGGGGSWAGSPDQALGRYNGGTTMDNVSVAYTSYEIMAELMGINSNNGFLANNWKDTAFYANDLVQAVGNNSSLNTALRMGRPTTMLHLPPGITFAVRTSAINIVSKIATPIARAAPWVAFGTIGISAVSNRQFTAGDAYQTFIPALLIAPGWGLLIGSGALIAEGVSYRLTGQSVSDNINQKLNGDVIFKW